MLERMRPEPVKALVLDVETLPLLGYSFNPWNTSITPKHLVKDYCILSFSAKWLNSDKIISEVLTPKEAKTRDDSRILLTIWNLLDVADIVITHNGKRFDMRKLNARFWKHGFFKPSSYKVIDTLESARSVFGLTYNSADYIAEYLDLQSKLDTGFQLWVDCDNGDSVALQYMREYNDQDIRLQEKIYMQMRGWIKNHPDFSIYSHDDLVCPVCLSKDYEPIGLFTAKVKQYLEYRCDSCGAIWHNSKAANKE